MRMNLEVAYVLISLTLVCASQRNLRRHERRVDKLDAGRRRSPDRLVPSEEFEAGGTGNPNYSPVADQVEEQGEYNLTKIYDVIHRFHKNETGSLDEKTEMHRKGRAQIHKKSMAQSKARKRQYELIGKLDPRAPGHILRVSHDDHVPGIIFDEADDFTDNAEPIAPADDHADGVRGAHWNLPFMPSLDSTQHPGYYPSSEGDDHSLYEHETESIPMIYRQGAPNAFPVPLLASFPTYDDHVHYYQKNPDHRFKDLHMTQIETVFHHRIHDFPCQNGGLPIRIGQSFQCICKHGFIGKHCQDRDFCEPRPCANEGQCFNVPDLPRFRCTCKLGFFGELCAKKDPCYPNPCRNRGKCTHDGKKHVCVCGSKFKGSHCEYIKSCYPNPCSNSGTCIEKQKEGTFQCDCVPPWRGQLCREHSYCHSNPCRNGGTCREKDDGFECMCLSGWYGRICADSACQPNPCFNGGTCMEERNNTFRCVCMPWHSGRLCEESRPCLTKPCMHDGKCIDAFSGYQWSFGSLQYYCLCKSPYIGLQCEQHACRDCSRYAHCEVDRCVCDDGYEGNGIICKKTSNLCHPNPCFNDGVCIELYAEQFEVQKKPCTSGEACGFKCVCNRPFIPPLCRDKNPCEPDPCKNGYCIVREGQAYECKCNEGYKGTHCDERDVCKPNPCQHHGICRPVNGTPSCECLGRWHGHLCKDCGCPKREVPGIPDMSCNQAGDCVCPPGYNPDYKDGVCAKEPNRRTSPCASNPCLNGGTCIVVTDTDFKCLCNPGFYGSTCQHKTHCNPNPCKNGGVCKEADGKFLGCDCPPGYLQPFCDKDNKGRGVCTPNPCKNQGICVPNKGGYDCVCIPRFTGPHCEVDKCAHCDQHASCIAGRCRCKAGYIGNGYECVKEECPVCPMYATCHLGGCVCHQGYVMNNGYCRPLDTYAAAVPTLPCCQMPECPDTCDEENKVTRPPDQTTGSMRPTPPTRTIPTTIGTVSTLSTTKEATPATTMSTSGPPAQSPSSTSGPPSPPVPPTEPISVGPPTVPTQIPPLPDLGPGAPTPPPPPETGQPPSPPPSGGALGPPSPPPPNEGGPPGPPAPIEKVDEGSPPSAPKNKKGSRRHDADLVMTEFAKFTNKRQLLHHWLHKNSEDDEHEND